MRNPDNRNSNSNLTSECDYSVEFQCVSTYLVGFRGATGLTERQILRKAVEVADDTFQKGGTLSIERSFTDGFYLFTALGIDRATGQILGETVAYRPKLTLVK